MALSALRISNFFFFFFSVLWVMPLDSSTFFALLENFRAENCVIHLRVCVTRSVSNVIRGRVNCVLCTQQLSHKFTEFIWYACVCVLRALLLMCPPFLSVALVFMQSVECERTFSIFIVCRSRSVCVLRCYTNINHSKDSLFNFGMFLPIHIHLSPSSNVTCWFCACSVN